MSYRLYLISGLTRRFEPAKEIAADNDDEAIAMADEARALRPAELWRGNRMIKEWNIDGADRDEAR
jgi:hypothetical protein